MSELRGRTALVTGASRGIGVGIARALSREGMSVALVARSAQALERLSAELIRAGARAVAIPADLADLSRVETLIEEAEKKLGPIDVLVNNAGIIAMRSFVEEKDSGTEEMLRVNLLSPMLLTRRVLPGMLSRKRGHIVNIASLAGKLPVGYEVTYSASKSGLIGFTFSLRAELRGTGVSASVVSPGFVTGEGMFAEKEQAHGVKVSALVGTSRVEQVAAAVVSAIAKDRPDISVNPGPIRLIQAMRQLAPGAVAWIQERLGVERMIRSIAVAERTEEGRRALHALGEDSRAPRQS